MNSLELANVACACWFALHEAVLDETPFTECAFDPDGEMFVRGAARGEWVPVQEVKPA